MRSPYLTYSLLFFLLMACCSIPQASAQNQLADPLVSRTGNELLVDLARLIKEHTYDSGGAVTFRYDAYADTTTGRKLYISQQITVFGDADDARWYRIDFQQPLKADQLKVIQGRNGYILIDASRRITKRLKRRIREGQHENRRNARLFIQFSAKKNNRKVDYNQLHDQLSDIVSHLTKHNTNRP